MSSGQIVQIIGAVVDVEFARNDVPKIYDALIVDEKNLTLEVQQQLGDGIARTIAMGASEGLQRGLSVSNTNAPITVPVGTKTLGRVMNVLGEPVDDAGDIGAESSMPKHSCRNYSAYFSNQARMLSILAISCDGRPAIPCDASGTRIKAVSIFLSFNAW